MPDFTRFDFYVGNFLNSEDVKRMTASEVGQFILLLCDAWCIGKDATLPDDPAYLARIARVDKVSPLVMKKFYKLDTESGQRYQNERLYKEWVATNDRFSAAQERSKKANGARWGTQNTTRSPYGIQDGVQQASPKSNHISPIHSKSNQSTPKEVIQKIYAADDAEIAEDTRQHLEKLAEEARVAKLSEGQLF